MYDYCTRMRRTIREVLDDFHSVRIPREYIFDVFPPMRTRSFSIASSIKVDSLPHGLPVYESRLISRVG